MIRLREEAMKNAKTIIIAVLAGMTVFCVYKYIASVQENNSLSANIRQLNMDVQSLEEEKNGLVKDLSREKEINIALGQDIAGLKDNLTQSQEKMTQLESDFQVSQKAIEDLSSEFSLVKAENTALRDQVQGLQLDISQAKAEKEQMRAQLNSIEELKKAIKALRQKTRSVKKQIQNRIEVKEKILSNNNGFIVKNGKATLSGTIKIEVEPLPGS
jgi:chromosome segregation ATPase